jgi:hypothetical protein
MKRIKILANRAITPPSLLGIARRIAYAQRKYHSGLICKGVTNGLAGRKFSGSLSKSGVKRDKNVKRVKRTKNPIRSLIV